MSARELVEELASCGVTLHAEGGGLKGRGSGLSALSAAQREAIAAHRRELICHLKLIEAGLRPARGLYGEESWEDPATGVMFTPEGAQTFVQLVSEGMNRRVAGAEVRGNYTSWREE